MLLQIDATESSRDHALLVESATRQQIKCLPAQIFRQSQTAIAARGHGRYHSFLSESFKSMEETQRAITNKVEQRATTESSKAPPWTTKG